MIRQPSSRRLRADSRARKLGAKTASIMAAEVAGRVYCCFVQDARRLVSASRPVCRTRCHADPWPGTRAERRTVRALGTAHPSSRKQEVQAGRSATPAMRAANAGSEMRARSLARGACEMNQVELESGSGRPDAGHAGRTSGRWAAGLNALYTLTSCMRTSRADVKRRFTSRAEATEPHGGDASGFRLDTPSAPADDTVPNASIIAHSP